MLKGWNLSCHRSEEGFAFRISEHPACVINHQAHDDGTHTEKNGGPEDRRASFRVDHFESAQAASLQRGQSCKGVRQAAKGSEFVKY